MAEIKLTQAHRENEVNQFASFPIQYNENGRCSYCGSLSPSDLCEAIDSGITLSFSDMKYGWPHKIYLSSEFKGGIKFYTLHLRDASEEEKLKIAKACGLYFKFDVEEQGDISWAPVLEAE